MVDRLLAAAETLGFSAAVVPSAEVVFRPGFRRYCQDNVCGKYGKNPSCPPSCGEPEELRRALTAHGRVLTLQSRWDIRPPYPKEELARAKWEHNHRALELAKVLPGALYAGACECSLCPHCPAERGEPCRFPDRRYSCLSAYCVDVAALAVRCGMPYFLPEGGIALFSLFAFDEIAGTGV